MFRRLLAIAALVLLTVAGCGRTREESAERSWIRDAVVYEIFIRSFVDSDGDGHGDLTGLKDRLDYLNDGARGGTDLGVDALLLCSPFDSPSTDGYDVSNYETVHPDFGTVEDFQALCADAHERGMHVLMDLPLNATSVYHPWFMDASMSAEAEHRDWYVWSETNPGWTQPGEPTQPTWHPFGNAFYYALHRADRPDLNVESGPVIDELLRIGRLWLDRGVDGFRLPDARFLVETGPGAGQVDTQETVVFWQTFASAMRRHRPDVVLLGEVVGEVAAIPTYAGADRAGFNATTDLAVANAVVRAIRLGHLGGLRTVLEGSEAAFGPNDRALSLGGRDRVRLSRELQLDRARLGNAVAVALTLEGVPILYYGDELGVRANEQGGVAANRTPMPWDPGAPGHGFTKGEPWNPFGDAAERTNVLNHVGRVGSLFERTGTTSHFGPRRWRFAGARCAS